MRQDRARLAGGPPAGESARGRRSRLLTRLPLLGLAPFAIYTLLFLAIPTVAVMVGAFRSGTGAFTWSNIATATSKQYAKGFESSLELAVVTAVVPGIAGVIIAYAVHRSPSGNILRRVVSTASGVFANFGGLPLAFLFIATIGSTGQATAWLSDLGFNPYNHGFTLYSFWGVAIAYLYFQIPLMVLVVTPALQGLRPAWREASANLGAGNWQYWRRIGVPVLAPAVLGSVLLLFGSALSAYATADALTSGTILLTPIQIGSFLNGNVIAGQTNVGKALGLGLIVIIAVAIALYSILQRRVSRWLR